MFMTLKNLLFFSCCSKKMWLNKALPFILQLFIFTLLVLLPFVQPSSSSGIYGTYNSGNRHIATSNIEVSRVVNEGGLVGTVEESERLVPTGPDPLHHNNNPIRH